MPNFGDDAIFGHGTIQVRIPKAFLSQPWQQHSHTMATATTPRVNKACLLSLYRRMMMPDHNGDPPTCGAPGRWSDYVNASNW